MNQSGIAGGENLLVLIVMLEKMRMRMRRTMRMISKKQKAGLASGLHQ